MSDDGLQTYQVAFCVDVEVRAADELDAIHVAEAACCWPGNWSPLMKPVEHLGEISHRRPVSASVIRSRALMVKEVDVP